jgi:hypothetical protein
VRLGEWIRVGVLGLVLWGGHGRPANAGEEAKGIGLNLDVEVASTYLFRGLNLYRDADEQELRQYPRLSPGVAWKIFDTGLTISYWGAFQLGG